MAWIWDTLVLSLTASPTTEGKGEHLAAEAWKLFLRSLDRSLRPRGGFVSQKVERDAILLPWAGWVSLSCVPPLQAISAHPPVDPAWEREIEEALRVGGILPVGEALWQEGICGHRVYLTSPATDCLTWAVNDSGMAGVSWHPELGRVTQD